MQTEAEGGGQLEQIARTFGVDWPHLIAADHQLRHRVRRALPLAYKPSCRCSSSGASRSRAGWPTPRRSRPSWPGPRRSATDVLAQANAQADQLIEEARAAAARVQAEETQKAIAAAEQIMARAREAAERDHDRMLAELKREVGRLVVQTTAAVTGKVLTPEDQRRLAEETARAARARDGVQRERAMKANQASQTRRRRRLFRLCLVDGLLDEGRVRQVAQRVAASRRRGALAILSHFRRLVRLDSRPAHGRRRERHAAAGRSAGRHRGRPRARVRPGLDTSFAQNPALIGGMRIKVGSDVYDGSVRARLAALEARLMTPSRVR